MKKKYTIITTYLIVFLLLLTAYSSANNKTISNEKSEIILHLVGAPYQAPNIHNEFAEFLNQPQQGEYYFKVYPNPTKKFIIFEFDAELVDKMRIEIYDMAGKLAHNYGGTGIGNNYRYDTSSLPEGIYYVKFTVDHTQDVVTRKFIVAR